MVLLLPQPWGLEHIVAWCRGAMTPPATCPPCHLATTPKLPNTENPGPTFHVPAPHFRTTTSGLGLLLPSASTEMSAGYLLPPGKQSAWEGCLLVLTLSPESQGNLLVHPQSKASIFYPSEIFSLVSSFQLSFFRFWIKCWPLQYSHICSQRNSTVLICSLESWAWIVNISMKVRNYLFTWSNLKS